MPTVTDFTEIHLFIKPTANVNITLPTCKWQEEKLTSLTTNKMYEFIFTYAVEWLGKVIVYN